jgi:hypothetical protein
LKICGIDNGVSGSVVMLLDEGNVIYFPTPVKKELSYTKKKQFVNRLDVENLMCKFQILVAGDSRVYIERPMVNPVRWKASMSAMRCLEATQVVLDILGIRYEFIDSRKWQRMLLPVGLHKEELKQASLLMAQRLFPLYTENVKDGDAFMIAEYGRRINQQGGQP